MKNVKKLGLQHHSPPYTIIISGISSLRDIVCKNRAVFGIFGSDGLKKSLFFVMW